MNLASMIADHPAEAVALLSRGQPTTYGELRAQVDQVRARLVRLGIDAGDRVALVLANNPRFAISYLAVLGAGAVAVPLNPASPTAELAAQLATAQVKTAIVGPTARAAFAAIDRTAPTLSHLEHVVVIDGPRAAGAAGAAGAGAEGSEGAEGAVIDGAVPLDALPAGDPVPVAATTSEDLAVLVFTSGIAGAPKAAMLTHGNLLANIRQVQQLPDRALGPDDVVLGVLPLFHIFGLNVALGLTLYAGASVVLVERFDPASALDTIRDRGVTVVLGAPPMYAAWAAATTPPSTPSTDMASVRLAVSGASALARSVAEQFQARFGVAIAEGYGLTEAAPTVTSSAVGGDAKAGSVGVPLPGVEVRLVDEDGEDCLAGDPGEVWVRGPNVFAGYWNDPEATRRVLTPDGWLRTGDLAVADDAGNLYLVGRSKDLVIVSGFNVHPGEVEEVLRAHPGVGDVAVVGVDHPHTGETVKAFVVPSPGRHVEEDEIITFASTRLARYKCPTKVTFVDSLPQGLGGKVVRRALS